MLSIVIADDEAGIIELCKMLIEYPNAAVVGEAHNGLELFDKIGELHPNTVITDVSMPGMTGLELIEEAQTVYPDVNFIVMSGYTDFEYVQKALRFGVWDYLLKPLQKDELNRILRKLDEKLENHQLEVSRQVSVQDDLEKSMQALRERYLLDVWQTDTPMPVPKIGEKEVLSFDDARIQCLLFTLERQFVSQAQNDSPLRQQAAAVIDELVEAARKSCREVYTLSDISFETVLLLFPEEDEWADRSEDLLRRISSQLRDYNSHNNFVHLSCAASELVAGSSAALPRVYAQVKEAIKGRLEKREGNVLRYERAAALALQQSHPFTQGDALRDAVLEQDIDRAARLIRADWAALSMPRPGMSFLLMEEQLRCLNDALRQLPGAEKLPAALRITVKDALSGGASPDEIPGRLCELLCKSLHEYRDFFATCENNMILQAKQYVARHFSEDITLNDIAKHVCLSPAYFSTLFKNETGIGFVKYLQHIRVEHAKKLLKTSKMRISDIAQAVGYRDLKFFNKIFYNETNVTPSEFRKFYS